MIKKIFLLLSFCGLMFTSNVSLAEDFDDDLAFDNFAIVDDTDSDMTAESVSLNSGAGVVNVKQFDIAGVMLGMNYDQVNDLFFNGSGLYAPRQKK